MSDAPLPTDAKKDLLHRIRNYNEALKQSYKNGDFTKAKQIRNEQKEILERDICEYNEKQTKITDKIPLDPDSGVDREGYLLYEQLVKETDKGPKILFDQLADWIVAEYNVVSFEGTLFYYVPYTEADKENSGIYFEDKGFLNKVIHECLKDLNFDGTKSITNVINQIREWMLTSPRAYHATYPFNTNLNGIPVMNGVLTFTNGGITFTPLSKDVKITTKLPVYYNPDASGQIIRDMFLRVLDGNEEDVDVLYNIFAAGLLQTFFNKVYKKHLIIVGERNTGKSTILDMFKMVAGGRNVANLPLQHVGDKFNSAYLENKIFNIYDDLDKITLTNLGRFKEITGTLSHQIERKGQDSYSGSITAVHIFARNYSLPRLDDVNDEAFLQRWEILVMNNIFESDANFQQNTFTQENLSGFLNDVLIRVKETLKTGIIPSRHNVIDTREMWLFKSDDKFRFIKKYLEKSLDQKNDRLDKELVYGIYEQFCNENGLIVETEEEFHKFMKLMGFVEIRPAGKDDRKRCYIGKLKGTTKGEVMCSASPISPLHYTEHQETLEGAEVSK